ncbi:MULTISPECIES: helix-turn-helix domain-containing protein [Pontibacillus]|uniref:Helix-turn-helix domain-containing protein n=1 Tax=Pontibacillus chungwhensis TaxID=265426 RepID=A0ABY8USM2_9BACI|nr:MULTISPECIES: helix-turn-helix domain-containing protein [Pontibacillus]MCD5323030.1 helix-turn-helix domain-containing protein [Pontibacillus sp. HN14]WIF96423.1 helix-turn-helix domain-containing protein [Pontibacillus chungwhensis]
MFTTLLLHSIHQLKGERSTSAILHMLTGKKSSQTFQDVYAYGLSTFFGIYRTITREELMAELKSLQANHYIETKGKEIHLTTAGISHLQTHPIEKTPLYWLNGAEFQHMDQLFWGRLLVFVQTASNIASGQHQFIPVEDHSDILKWVKMKYRSIQGNLNENLTFLYEELYALLKELPEWVAECTTLRFSSHHRYGMSKEQLAIRYDLKIHDITIVLQAVIHYLLRQILKHQERYPYLYGICEDLIVTLPLTQSAQKTLEWINKGHSLDRISKIRNLKMSTIQDHIVEIALVNPLFKIDEYVSKEAAQNISHTAKELNTNRLKAIRDHLDGIYSYFEIRLVLAAAQGASKHAGQTT